MATPQQRRDELARSRGFKSYYDQRNAAARAEGYSSYSAKRTGKAPVSAPGSPTPRPGQGKPASVATTSRYIPPPGGPTLRDPLEMAKPFKYEFKASSTKIYEVSREGKTGGALFSQVVPELDWMDLTADSFGEELPNVFTEGLKKGTGLANPVPLPEDVDRLEKIQKQTAKDLKAVTAHGKGDLDRLNRGIKGIDKDDPQYQKKVHKFTRDNPLRGATYSDGTKRSMNSSSQAVIDAATMRAYNVGTIAGARSVGVDVFEVDDGPDCGWTAHRSGKLAAGMIVEGDDAFAHPIAHAHCRRAFTPRPDLPRPGKLKDRFKTGKGVVVRQTVKAAVSTAAKSVAKDIIRAEAERILRNTPQFRAITARFDHYEKVLKGQGAENILDLVTGQPMAFGAKALVEEVREDMAQWVAGLAIKSRTRQLIGVSEAAPRKVVGDAFNDFNDYSRLRFKDSTIDLEDLAHIGDLDYAMQELSDSFFNWVGERGPGYLRQSFPKLRSRKGLNRAARTTLRLTDFVNIKQTFRSGTKNKWKGLTDLNLNPKGMLRAGFRLDSETNVIVPFIRAIPTGPIRVNTSLNRSVGRAIRDGDGFEIGRAGKGRVTSLSVEVRLITKNIKLLRGVRGQFNLNLRALDIYRASDITKLRLEDFRRMGWDDLQWVSSAADFHMRGFNLFDMAKTVRVNKAAAQQINIGARIGYDAWNTLQPNGFDSAFGLFMLDAGRAMSWREAEKIFLIGRQKARLVLGKVQEIVYRRPSLQVIEGGLKEANPLLTADVNRLKGKLRVLESGDESGFLDVRDLELADELLRAGNEELMNKYKVSLPTLQSVREIARDRLTAYLTKFEELFAPKDLTGPNLPGKQLRRGPVAPPRTATLINDKFANRNLDSQGLGPKVEPKGAALPKLRGRAQGRPSVMERVTVLRDERRPQAQARAPHRFIPDINKMPEGWTVEFDNSMVYKDQFTIDWSTATGEIGVDLEQLVTNTTRALDDLIASYPERFPQNVRGAPKVNVHLVDKAFEENWAGAWQKGGKDHDIYLAKQLHSEWDPQEQLLAQTRSPTSGTSWFVPVADEHLQYHTVVHESGHMVRSMSRSSVEDALRVNSAGEVERLQFDGEILERLRRERPETFTLSPSQQADFDENNLLRPDDDQLEFNIDSLQNWFYLNQNVISKEVSDYAATDLEELFAESWTQYKIGTRKTWLSDLFGNAMDEAMRTGRLT